MKSSAGILVLAALLATAPVAATAGQRCDRRDELRNVFFGDLHIHTTFSQDASTQGTRNRPRDAYRFARGEPLGIQPYDENGQPLRTLRLSRPLDFAAVTDHAEQLGETLICNTPTLPGYDSWVCRIYRRWPRFAFFVMNTRTTYFKKPSRFGYCGEGGLGCLDAARTTWQETLDAAAAANDESRDCAFTTFLGYEWTAAPGSNNLHRNIIFAGDQTLDLPVSYYEAQTPESLWSALRTQCLDRTDGCDALIIPHNSNLSGGLMFETVDGEGQAFTEPYARTRAEFEPLVEVLQHKGDSECIRSPTTVDEECDFEKLPYSNFRGKYVEALSDPPVPRGFIRDALKAGLVEEQRIGANPFKFGMIGSTDTHLAASGAVAENRFVGHGGAGVPARESVPVGLPDDLEFNPGGLAAVWAEENSREAIFAALRRREVYATSGPRFRVRFFAGWNYPSNLCDSPERDKFAATGYHDGVPMGGDLPVAPRGDKPIAPNFAIWALADPGEDGQAPVPLDRIQIIKGSVDSHGQVSERVFDAVAASAGGERASVDPARCEPERDGPKSLCTVWTDPDFDPDSTTFYYARVLENPTCRWSQLVCNQGDVDCGDPATIRAGFEACCIESHRPIIQERAWTSPIWYSPALR